MRQPAGAEEGGVGAVRVGGLDHEVAAGAEYGQRGTQFGAGIGDVRQVVEHADHVVAGAQPVGDAGRGEQPPVGLLDAALVERPLDTRGGVEPVEAGVREELLGGLGEVTVPGADVEPALRVGQSGEGAGGGPVAPARQRAVGVIGGPGVLEGVGAVAAPVEGDGAGPLPAGGSEPGAQAGGAAPGTVLAARAGEPVADLRGGGRGRHGGSLYGISR